MFPLINPVQTFSQGMGVVPNFLSDLNTLQKQRQTNQLQQMLMPYAAPEAQARLAVTQAMAPFYQARADRYNSLAGMSGSKIIQTPNGYYSYNPLTGESQPINAPGGNQLMPKNTGMQITSSPGGGFSITTGGMQYNQPQPLPLGQQTMNKLQTLTNGQQMTVNPQQVNALQQLPQQSQQTAQGNNIVQSPASPHSRYSNAGSTLIDANTGNALSVPTNQTVSKFQNAMAAGDVVSPQLRNIYKQIEPFIGPGNLAKRAAGFLDRYTNTPNPEYDAYTSANQTLLPQTGDLMLGEMKLNQTKGNREALQKAITPEGIGLEPPDTAASYAKKYADTLAGIAMRDNKYQHFLKAGVSLQPQNDEDAAALQQAISDKIYWELRKQNAPSKTIGGNTWYNIDGQWHKPAGQ